jgi:hypothetical protein
MNTELHFGLEQPSKKVHNDALYSSEGTGANEECVSVDLGGTRWGRSAGVLPVGEEHAVAVGGGGAERTSTIGTGRSVRALPAWEGARWCHRWGGARERHQWGRGWNADDGEEVVRAAGGTRWLGQGSFDGAAVSIS